MFAFLPIPFAVAGVGAGAARYPIRRFLFYVIAGKVLQLTIVALAAHYSLSWFLDIIN